MKYHEITGVSENTTPAYIPTVDSLRFFAFLLIFLHHTAPGTFPILEIIREFGWVGVDLFLALSAFLLTRLLLFELQHRKEINFLKYFVRRTLRIWPLYFGYLLAMGFIYVIIDLPSFSFARWLTLITFTDNIAAAVADYNPNFATGHLWTLSFEEQFYFILPFVLSIIYRGGKKASTYILISVIITGVISRFVLQYYNTSLVTIWVLPLTHFESILAGVLLAFLLTRVNKITALSLLAFTLISITTLLLMPRDTDDFFNLFVSYTNAGILSFLILALTIRSASTQNNQQPRYNLCFKFTQYLGKISYGLYVFHLLSLKIIYHFNPFSNQFVNDLCALMFCIVLAVFSFEFFEKKFLALKSKYTVIH